MSQSGDKAIMEKLLSMSPSNGMKTTTLIKDGQVETLRYKMSLFLHALFWMEIDRYISYI